MSDTHRVNEIVGSTMCKKCGGEHAVEAYRGLMFYYCPVVHRVLLVSEEAHNVQDTSTSN